MLYISARVFSGETDGSLPYSTCIFRGDIGIFMFYISAHVF